MSKKTVLIIGANSDIAKAIALQVIKNNNVQLIVISRDISFFQTELFKNALAISITHYQEDQINLAVTAVNKIIKHPISQIYICHGLLHNQRCTPEKRLEDFSPDAFIEIITANTITPMLWIKHLTPTLVMNKIECNVVIFSARVGSISDNKLGGWYSYRASKAAINMLIKSAAVELARRAKKVKLVIFHPGTTDTPLSKPFQKNVPKEKLFTSNFVSTQLLAIMENINTDGNATYIDWEGKEITW